MAQLNEVFNVADVPESQRSYDPLPDGWYTAFISKTDLCATKAGTGQYIKVRYDVTGPTHQGRVVFGNFNVRNPNPKAEEIGREQLRDLCLAVGLKTVVDTDQLIGSTVSIKIATRKQDGFDPTNEIKGWKAIEGGSIPRPSQPGQVQPPSAGSSPTPPWAKK